jgi:nicotinate-nucleotide pyrophosphorylase (carboxylating)
MVDILDDWLAEDLGNGDVTSQSVVDNSICKAEVSGGPGIISGLAISRTLLSKVNIESSTSFSDSDEIKSVVSVLSLSGKAHDILKVERLLLNLLCHLSGVATLTAKVVSAAKSVNPKVEILATRKTIPGFRELEKQAVVHGGGQPHRMRLDGAILIKDNHLRLCKEITKAIERSRMKHPDLMIEVEVDNSEQALEVAKSGADRVMLDNFTPEVIEETVLSLRKISDIEIEVSGGITIDNIKAYAPFADFISLGSLTMAAPPVDFSLHVS